STNPAPGENPSPSRVAMALGISFKFVEKHMSSAYLLTTHRRGFASSNSFRSNDRQITFEITGEVGAPGGSTPLNQHSCASGTATSAGNTDGADLNIPKTRPKFIEGKKPSMSAHTTQRLLACSAA